MRAQSHWSDFHIVSWCPHTVLLIESISGPPNRFYQLLLGCLYFQQTSYRSHFFPSYPMVSTCIHRVTPHGHPSHVHMKGPGTLRSHENKASLAQKWLAPWPTQISSADNSPYISVLHWSWLSSRTLSYTIKNRANSFLPVQTPFFFTSTTTELCSNASLASICCCTLTKIVIPDQNSVFTCSLLLPLLVNHFFTFSIHNRNNFFTFLPSLLLTVRFQSFCLFSLCLVQMQGSDHCGYSESESAGGISLLLALALILSL